MQYTDFDFLQPFDDLDILYVWGHYLAKINGPLTTNHPQGINEPPPYFTVGFFFFFLVSIPCTLGDMLIDGHSHTICANNAFDGHYC